MTQINDGYGQNSMKINKKSARLLNMTKLADKGIPRVSVDVEFCGQGKHFVDIGVRNISKRQYDKFQEGKNINILIDEKK